ncbi:Hypothetical predicted protein [Olea europaea subsp. europaea]|uniref:Uncharacterized protein n=1 Tax=Olea europaea subsp. europaea TaxID=158383 RepID=A0A8S0SLE4_OLEEU|nr:Hypothetical predicted protein [Olea europaea subsp. europaea]
MALSFTRFSWWWSAEKEKEQVSNGSSVNSLNSLSDWGLGLRGEPEGLKFPSVKGTNSRMPPWSSNRKLKKKWKSREERRRIDKEYDVVVVPSDGVCLSGSESDDSDWSIGWLEPHAPGFQSDDEADGSFAVLVPCYRHDCEELEGVDEEGTGSQFLSAIRNLPNQYSSEGKKFMEQWLSSYNNY